MLANLKCRVCTDNQMHCGSTHSYTCVYATCITGGYHWMVHVHLLSCCCPWLLITDPVTQYLPNAATDIHLLFESDLQHQFLRMCTPICKAAITHTHVCRWSYIHQVARDTKGFVFIIVLFTRCAMQMCANHNMMDLKPPSGHKINQYTINVYTLNSVAVIFILTIPGTMQLA